MSRKIFLGILGANLVVDVAHEILLVAGVSPEKLVIIWGIVGVGSLLYALKGRVS